MPESTWPRPRRTWARRAWPSRAVATRSSAPSATAKSTPCTCSTSASRPRASTSVTPPYTWRPSRGASDWSEFPLLLRLQHVHRADRARRIPSWREGAGQGGLGAPARAVPGRHHTWPDALLEVGHRRLDAALHRPAAEVKAAEHHVERGAAERVTGAEAGVDHAGVRTGREHADAAAAHVRSQKPLVEDERIGLALAVAEAEMAHEPL